MSKAPRPAARAPLPQDVVLLVVEYFADSPRALATASRLNAACALTHGRGLESTLRNA